MFMTPMPDQIRWERTQPVAAKFVDESSGWSVVLGSVLMYSIPMKPPSRIALICDSVPLGLRMARDVPLPTNGRCTRRFNSSRDR